MTNKPPHPAPSPKTVADETPRPNASTMIDSQTLFKGHREIQICHGQDLYRLRQTQAGKLILTK